MPSAAVVTQVRTMFSTVRQGQLTSLAWTMEQEAQLTMEPGAKTDASRAPSTCGTVDASARLWGAVLDWFHDVTL